MCEYFDEITLLDDTECQIGEVVSFLLDHSVNLELQGRIFSIYKEDDEVMIEICLLRRGIKGKKGDYVDGKNSIYHYYDTDEIIEISSSLLLCPVYCLYVEKGLVSKQYFLEEVDAKDRKRMIYYSEYQSPSGKILPAVTSQLKMLWYHFNPLEIEHTTQLSPTDSATGFLYVLKENVFDPFVSPLSMSRRRSNPATWNSQSWKSLILGAIALSKGEKWKWIPIDKELFIFEDVVIPFILVVLFEWFRDRHVLGVYEAVNAIYELRDQVDHLTDYFATIKEKTDTLNDREDAKWYADKEERRKKRKRGEEVESEEEDDESFVSSDKSLETVTEIDTIDDSMSSTSEESLESNELADDDSY